MYIRLMILFYLVITNLYVYEVFGVVSRILASDVEDASSIPESDIPIKKRIFQ